jgi:hypothetical protein
MGAVEALADPTPEVTARADPAALNAAFGNLEAHDAIALAVGRLFRDRIGLAACRTEV